jgi:hypothetical protein
MLFFDASVDFGPGGGYTDCWGTTRFGIMAAASQAVLRSEEEAKGAFRAAKKEMEENEDPPPSGKTTIFLLQPFREFVLKHPGWKSKQKQSLLCRCHLHGSQKGTPGCERQQASRSSSCGCYEYELFLLLKGS